jgi:hypothetical protein
MLKKVKIDFVDFWGNFDKNNNVFIECLSSLYDVSIDENPDYLFYSTFGSKHLKYKNCIKIYYTGENDAPDFNFCDYAIGFQHIKFEDRYLRYPLYLLYPGYKELKDKYSNENLANRKFCNFVYSNAKYSTPLREQFFLTLSKYKRVDSGGKLHNNIGGPVLDKINFIKDYKFTISFENSALSGYTTEKLLEPMTVNSLPVYWGNPTVQTDFNKESFLCIQDHESIEKAIEEIIRLDKDDNAYLQKLAIPWQTNEQLSKDWEFELSSFLCNILNQPLTCAKRTSIYGYAIIKRIKEAKWAKIANLPIIRNI